MGSAKLGTVTAGLGDGCGEGSVSGRGQPPAPVGQRLVGLRVLSCGSLSWARCVILGTVAIAVCKGSGQVGHRPGRVALWPTARLFRLQLLLYVAGGARQVCRLLHSHGGADVQSRCGSSSRERLCCLGRLLLLHQVLLQLLQKHWVLLRRGQGGLVQAAETQWVDRRR